MIQHADSLKWREGYLICFDTDGRALASFDPEEVESCEVVDDLPGETAAPKEPRHVRWLKTLRRQKDPSPIPNGRVESLMARIKRQREGLGEEPLPLSLLTFGDEDSDMNEWIRAASAKIRAASDQQKEEDSRAGDGAEPSTAGLPPSIDKHSTEELVRLLGGEATADPDRELDKGSADEAADSRQAKGNA